MPSKPAHAASHTGRPMAVHVTHPNLAVKQSICMSSNSYVGQLRREVSANRAFNSPPEKLRMFIGGKMLMWKPALQCTCRFCLLSGLHFFITTRCCNLGVGYICTLLVPDISTTLAPSCACPTQLQVICNSTLAHAGVFSLSLSTSAVAVLNRAGPPKAADLLLKPTRSSRIEPLHISPAQLKVAICRQRAAE